MYEKEYCQAVHFENQNSEGSLTAREGPSFAKSFLKHIVNPFKPFLSLFYYFWKPALYLVTLHTQSNFKLCAYQHWFVLQNKCGHSTNPGHCQQCPEGLCLFQVLCLSVRVNIQLRVKVTIIEREKPRSQTTVYILCVLYSTHTCFS